MANTKPLIAFFLHLMLAFSVLDLANAQGLKLGFYKTSCPSAEHIVKEITKKFISRAPTLAAPLLRMHFHDCFVRGCEGSVLLNSTKKNQLAEKDASPNLSLRGFQVIDAVKTALEKKCPGIVSCADILALVTRDAVSVINGPSWSVPTGRRDGRISIATDALKNLPSPHFNITQLKQSFASKGLSVKDLAVLSGGHTIGISHCPSFVNRLYNFNGKGDTDPTMDQNYIAHLKSKCKPTDTTTFVNLSPRSTHKFEPNYYTLVGKRRGLFQSDAALLNDCTTKAYIQLQAASKGSTFMKDFGESMVKMGQIGVLTGKSGEIRKQCNHIN
ncbi:Peroxidase 27 [Camellia lanceoleosa]|uniref:Peroxidase 27 n=1 Tax=Camellia lanceoleosa TaxID=1840588 RepID=A0ACC0HFY4_9ERIC|nr:Peroxidase 27 [Camellia lanceoleosa]